MTSTTADLADRPGDTGARRTTDGWSAVGRVSTVAALVLCVLLQAINHDFFPPAISVSQYGVGPNGWVFTCWTTVTALAVIALHKAGTTHGRGVGYWLAIGSVGLLVMGVVRTDAGGMQQSWHSKVHVAGSILALVALPIGMAMAMHRTRLWWRRTIWSLVLVSGAALVLVLISAAGVTTFGLDAARSWALWQAIAVTVDMLMLATFGLAGFGTERDDLRAPARPGERGADHRPVGS